MDFGKICAVTFSDAVGAFVIGIALGALVLWLVQQAMRKGGE